METARDTADTENRPPAWAHAPTAKQGLPLPTKAPSNAPTPQNKADKPAFKLSGLLEQSDGERSDTEDQSVFLTPAPGKSTLSHPG